MTTCQCPGDPLARIPFAPRSAAAPLAAFNRQWQSRFELCRDRIGAPWWAPGLVLNAEIRNTYEQYLPVAEFCAGLSRLARSELPHPSWVPRVIRAAAPFPCTPAAPRDLPSLPDLWSLLPTQLSGRVTYAEDELAALFCALADLRRFGTTCGRYPEQLRELTALFTARKQCDKDLRLLDLASGIGHGTLEVADTALYCGIRNLTATGVTVEPLEAWMAAQRRVPHDPPREAVARRYSHALPVRFVAADVRALPFAGPVDVVVCNGLVGGPEFHTEADVRSLLHEIRRLVAPGGLVLLANRFHDGRLRAIATFIDRARAEGWHVTGNPRDLRLARP